MQRTTRRAAHLVALLLALALSAAACSSSKAQSDSTSNGSADAKELTGTLRLGYFANLTHATALVGVADGSFTKALGPKVDFKTQIYNAGPDEVTALLSGALDAAYVGPGPAINAFQKSHGDVQIFSGATAGGAELVVQPNIKSAADLKGKKVASPQLGNTQDIALRTWLKSQGLSTNTTGGGDVAVTPQANADTLQLFKQKAIDGAWVPEPYATRLVKEDGGKVLVNEKDLWPSGTFVTTVLVVRTAFATSHPRLVRALLEGQVAATDRLNRDAAGAKTAANDQLAKLSGKALSTDVIDTAWGNLTFTVDPVASSLATGAAHANALGLLDSTDIRGIFNLTALNSVLRTRGEATVPS
jgi:NitT/TauT family transport system substrate-binding protein